MVRKLVSVDEGLHLPTAVRNQLSADLESDMTTYVTDAQTASGTAVIAADTASDARDEAVAAAASATAPTDSMVASLLASPGTATRTAADSRYLQLDQTTQFIDRRDADPVLLSDLAVGTHNRPTLTPVTASGSFSTVADYAASQHNDFPSLTLCADGSLISVFRKGSMHTVEIAASLYFSRSTDLGNSWSTPVQILADPNTDQRDPWLTTLSDGRVALTYFKAVGSTVRTAVLRFSSDNGTTWSSEILLPFTWTAWSVVNGLVEVDSSQYVVYGYGLNTGGTYTSTRALVSNDAGATWGSEVTISTSGTQNFNESCVVKTTGTTLIAFIRSDDGSGGGTNPGIYRSLSADGGVTWSAPVKVVDGWGRPAALYTDGSIVLTYRRFTSLAAMVVQSTDLGLTWSTPFVLDGDPRMTQSVYQEMTLVADGLIGVVYANEILSGTGAYVRFKYIALGSGPSPMGEYMLGPGTYDLAAYLDSGFVIGTGLPWNARKDGRQVTIYSTRFARATASLSMVANAPVTLVPAGGLPEHLRPRGAVDALGFVHTSGGFVPMRVSIFSSGQVQIEAAGVTMATYTAGTNYASLPNFVFDTLG